MDPFLKCSKNRPCHGFDIKMTKIPWGHFLPGESTKFGLQNIISPPTHSPIPLEKKRRWPGIYLICDPATSVHINLNQIPSYSTNQHNLEKYIFQGIVDNM